MDLQGISLRAGKPDSTITFEVSNDLERRCVDKLNRFWVSNDGVISLAASANGQPDKRELCRQLIRLVMASDMQEYDKQELTNFLACQSLKARKAQLLGGR